VDNGWTTDYKATITQQEKPTIELTTPPTAYAYSLYEYSTLHKLTHFYYVCLNYPVVSTLIKAIKVGYLRGWPGLIAERVQRHIDVSVESKQGYMNQVYQGQWSMQPTTATAPIVIPSDQVDSSMNNAPQELVNMRTHHVFMTVHVVVGCISSNNTGHFPVTSNQGNIYVALFYVYNANTIWSVPIRNRSKEELLRAVTEVYVWFTAWGYSPHLHKMDNETSHDNKAFIAAEQVKLQYTPPNMHRTSPAKRAVHSWKNHFTVGIAGLPPLFPLAHWCQLITQSNAMLNMMRPCHLNPLLSAHKGLEGTFSFNATPIAPLGTEVLVHQKPSQCKTWGYHATKAWYLSHAASHYHCICFIMKGTWGERIMDMFRYQHHAILEPFIAATNCIFEATGQLTNAINGVQEAPLDKMTAIQNLCTLLLGKVTLQEPEPHPQTCRTKAPLTVSPPAEPEQDNAPIFMWDPSANKTPAVHKSCPPAWLPTSPALTVIKDITNELDAPLKPIVRRCPACG
jgi:hypothetical protein